MEENISQTLWFGSSFLCEHCLIYNIFQSGIALILYYLYRRVQNMNKIEKNINKMAQNMNKMVQNMNKKIILET